MITELLRLNEGQVGPVDPAPAPPPLPGGAAEVVRFFMDVPQWIQIGGGLVGAVAAVVVMVLGWRHRTRVIAWVAGLPAVVKATAIAVIVAGGTIVSVAGYQVYDFVEYDNRFCTGCHVMADAYVRFEASPHQPLGCKDCHAQPKTESARQLYLWVLERPHEVGPHSPVPDARCTSCHVDEDPEQWPQIAASLGHRVHFDSDHEDLGELMCVTCHGVEVHEFTPAQATCGECHGEESDVRLGRMAAETELHCVACHDFLGDEPSDLPGIAEGMAMLPERAQCTACHEMTGLTVASEFDQDPHGAVCGACHNPHTQEIPFQASESCVGCHEDFETLTIYHTGTHAPVMPNCMECHSAHSWRVQGSECLDCHETVRDQVGWSAPAAGTPASGAIAAGTPVSGTLVSGTAVVGPFAAARAHATTPAAAGPGVDPRFPVAWALLLIHGDIGTGGATPPRPDEGGAGQPAAPSAAATRPVPDTIHERDPRPFLHREHAMLSCLECHGTANEHGVLTVRTARDCAACHHDANRGYECQACHAQADLEPPRTVAQTLQLTVWEASRIRDLTFEHGLHEGIECQECHTGPVFLEVELQCASCHDDHHRPEADCASCHRPTEPEVHGLEVHLTCTSSGCHAGTAGERPSLTRTLCLTCHTEQRDHEPGLECQSCHMVPINPPIRRGR